MDQPDGIQIGLAHVIVGLVCVYAIALDVELWILLNWMNVINVLSGLMLKAGARPLNSKKLS